MRAEHQIEPRLPAFASIWGSVSGFTNASANSFPTAPDMSCFAIGCVLHSAENHFPAAKIAVDVFKEFVFYRRP